MDRDILRIIRQVCEVFERLGIPYIVGGSIAGSPFGLSRLTKDIDIAAKIREEDIVPLVNALQAEYYIVPEAIVEAIQHGDLFNLIHFDTVWKVDVFVLGNDEWAESQLARRTRRRISSDEDSPEPFVTSLEDIVLQKLKWFHEGHSASHQQWQDVQLILRTNADRIDLDHLRTWSGRLGIADLLERALNEAGMTEG